jgi:hypothetical protein
MCIFSFRWASCTARGVRREGRKEGSEEGETRTGKLGGLRSGTLYSGLVMQVKLPVRWRHRVPVRYGRLQ